LKGMSHRIRSIGGCHALTVEEKSARGNVFALAFAEGRHELLELGCLLDLEEDLVVAVRNLDVKVLLVSIRNGVGRGVGLITVV